MPVQISNLCQRNDLFLSIVIYILTSFHCVGNLQSIEKSFRYIMKEMNQQKTTFQQVALFASIGH